ncbi:hypothetical protein AL050_02920 [Pseudomonas syringae pv. daphniphylli]|nr:hypothetical protein AL050_02920 [Pseudomonas syringae pv. daphniphylli]
MQPYVCFFLRTLSPILWLITIQTTVLVFPIPLPMVLAKVLLDFMAIHCPVWLVSQTHDGFVIVQLVRGLLRDLPLHIVRVPNALMAVL